ncbi:MAG: potassium channel family protein [Alphaproteobacteria bacterium]|nr:potassium channel family protein [Alphaproteobacteria bacterium]
MSLASETTSLFTSMGLAVVLVAICVLVHYECLRAASVLLPRLEIRPRARILFVMGVAFLAHSLEIWIYGVAYWLIAHYLAIGDIGGKVTGSFPEYIYFSTVSYTSLGLGDLYPTGALRLLTGVEALLGLAMIAWTGSFTYLAMEKFWTLHGARGYWRDN